MNNINKLTIQDITNLLGRTGYIINASEVKFTAANNLVKYEGYCNIKHQHKYFVGFYDDDNGYYVTRVFIYLGNGGEIQADYAGCPCYEFDDEEAIINFFKQ